MKKNIENFNYYAEKYLYVGEVTPEQCYLSSQKPCSTCMHCFPGNYYVDLENYAGRDVCMKAKRK